MKSFGRHLHTSASSLAVRIDTLLVPALAGLSSSAHEPSMSVSPQTFILCRVASADRTDSPHSICGGRTPSLSRSLLQHSCIRASRRSSPIRLLLPSNSTSRTNPSSLCQNRRPARSSTHKAGVMPCAHDTIPTRRHRNDTTRCPQTVASLRALVRHASGDQMRQQERIQGLRTRPNRFSLPDTTSDVAKFEKSVCGLIDGAGSREWRTKAVYARLCPRGAACRWMR